MFITIIVGPNSDGPALNWSQLAHFCTDFNDFFVRRVPRLSYPAHIVRIVCDASLSQKIEPTLCVLRSLRSLRE